MIGKHLFFCETKYALLSMLIIRYTQAKECEADIVFTDAADFSEIICRLKQMKVFGNVWQMQTRDLITDINRGTIERKQYADENPGEVLPLPAELKCNQHYTDLWLNLDSVCPKLFYYAMTSFGNDMNVHFVDEGNSSYFMDLSTLERDFMNHESRGEQSFGVRALDTYLYNPELYMNGTCEVVAKQLEKNILYEDWFQKIIFELFETENCPQEKYIFFEQCFNDDGGVVNDIEIIDHIAELVGKENIIIRLHPRSRVDRFSVFGYNVVQPSGALWEATLLKNNFENKVFITIDSTAIFSSNKLLESNQKIIILDELIWGDYKNKKNKKNSTYLSEMISLCNKDRINCYRPYTKEELDIVFDYLNYVDGVEKDEKTNC